MGRIVACGCLAQLAPEIIGALNGGTVPAAVTVGGLEIYFEPPTPAMLRHEQVHVIQSARFAPRWASWLPMRARAWLGAPAFWRAYAAEHVRQGYEFNRFEIEARAAEAPLSTEETRP